jgi:hypothetical protein
MHVLNANKRTPRTRTCNTGIALLVSILYTFLLKVAALPLVLTIMFAVWVMLGGALAMLGLKAGYIDAKSIPGSDKALTQMPAVCKEFTRAY